MIEEIKNYMTYYYENGAVLSKDVGMSIKFSQSNDKGQYKTIDIRKANYPFSFKVSKNDDKYFIEKRLRTSGMDVPEMIAEITELEFEDITALAKSFI